MTWLGFTNPWILTGLLAAGLPVLIHYLTRARPRRVSFPPFKFLIEACAGRQSMHRLRTIILLTVRTLAVLALVLVFTRPYLRPKAGTAEAGRRAVLILDASLSMRAVQQGVSLFARAQAEAADVLRSLEAGTEAGVILTGAKPHPLLPALSRNIPALHEALVKALPTFEYGDQSAALALAQKLLGGRGAIYIFSDFQKSNWDTVRELPAGIFCRLRPVQGELIDNVALTGIRLAPAEPVAGESAEVICTVLNSTARPRQETVRLELGDTTREAPVAVPPFATAEAVFNVTFSKAGLAMGHASLDPDGLPEDNTRYLAVRVQKALVLLLISDAELDDQSRAAFFVSRALAPSSAAAPGFAVVHRHGPDADRGILETADAFVLTPPVALAGEAVEIITRRVSDGAQFLAFLDGPTAPAMLLPGLSPPFRLQQVVNSETGDALLAGPKKLFAENDASDFTPLRFRRHYLNQVLPGRTNDVLFFYPDGSAGLTLNTVGKGAAVLANLPLTPESGDLVGSPTFPAMLHELLRQLRRGAEERTTTPGLGWTLDAPGLSEASIQVSDPSGRPLEAKTLSSGRTVRLALPVALVPGIYTARQGDAVIAAAAINVDPRESDTRPLALETLKSAQGGAATVVQEEQDLLLAGKTRPLWPELAQAAAFLFALEMLLLAIWRRRPAPAISPGPGLA